MDRKSSTSITHLVKIVAEEVVNEMVSSGKLTSIQDISNAVQPLEERIEKVERELGFSAEVFREIENTPKKWGLGKAGEIWTDDQDCRLAQDFNTALRWMAMRQGRTEVSIKCRIKRNIRSLQ